MAPLNSKGDQFYYQGGLTCSGCPTNSGYVFDLNQKSWRKVNDEPHKYGAQAHLVDDTIYYYGGYNSQMQFENATKPGVMKRLQGVNTTIPLQAAILQQFFLLLLHLNPEVILFTMIGGIEHIRNDIAERRTLVDMIPMYASPAEGTYKHMTLDSNSVMPAPRFGHTLMYMVGIENYMVVLFGKNANGSYVNNPVRAFNMETWEWTNELRLGAIPTPSASPTADASPTNGTNITNDAVKEIDNGATVSSGLRGGAIAGIVVGAVAGVAVIAAAGWFMSATARSQS
ncbi:uncharacterized protein BYT42DRAFT_606435 [Radiomyces spectabilis]|uniref:uncharacterized protein n=1 Tax=Radiomyces spectabilis TaxID=64574 RepID=UPI002220805A|nr:uncharacterized protein BYT42DRAFT_606435 [Radiomyces spectabilis]KAI8374547.1 hypothetical protein BYT42DRAFT_606435 [Radiomyces spectabilis]